MPFASNFNAAKFKTEVSSAFKQALQTYGTLNADWAKFTTTIITSAKTQNYPFLDAVPEMEEWVGEPIYRNVRLRDYSIVNKLYQTAISVDAEDVVYDNFGVLKPLFDELGRKSVAHTARMCFDALTNGFTEECYDGTAFFSSSHPNGSSTFDNDGGGSGSAWFLVDASRGIKPVIYQEHSGVQLVANVDPTSETVLRENVFKYYARKRCGFGYGIPQMAYASKQTLSSTNFDAAVEAMMGFTDSHGSPMGVRPTHLIVSPANRAEARAIIEAETLSSGASNVNFKAVELIVSPYLT